jgi:hypothetical protein
VIIIFITGILGELRYCFSSSQKRPDSKGFKLNPVYCSIATRTPTVLLNENIPHVCMVGVCLYQSKRLPIHLWIDLKGDLEGYRVDYSARRWLGYDPKGTKIITSCLLEP